MAPSGLSSPAPPFAAFRGCTGAAAAAHAGIRRPEPLEVAEHLCSLVHSLPRGPGRCSGAGLKRFRRHSGEGEGGGGCLGLKDPEASSESMRDLEVSEAGVGLVDEWVVSIRPQPENGSVHTDA